jgi:hypothetical protein
MQCIPAAALPATQVVSVVAMEGEAAATAAVVAIAKRDFP